MRVVKPITVTDSILTSSTIPEPDASKSEVTWTAGTRLLGEQFISIVTHRVYEVVADPSTTDDPVDGVNANPPTWVNVKPTNKWAMFDGVNSTQSEDTTQLVVTIEAAQITNSLAGINIDGASSINVTMDDPTAGEVFNEDISMIDNSEVAGWWEYFFSPIINITDFIILNLPLYPESTITVTVDGATISFGTLVIGNQLVLGISNFGTSVQLLDFSRKETDTFGNTVVTPGRTSKLVNYDFTVQRTKVGYVFNQLSELTGIPSVWVGTDETDDATLVYGYYRDFQNNISSWVVTDATLTIEGLV